MNVRRCHARRGGAARSVAAANNNPGRCRQPTNDQGKEEKNSQGTLISIIIYLYRHWGGPFSSAEMCNVDRSSVGAFHL
jgi:hypothetical protein